MASYKLHMPKMGESIHEATVLKWMVEEGMRIMQDDIILEVATDKVDSEIPSPVAGHIVKLWVSEGEVVNVGAVIAEIETDEEPNSTADSLIDQPVTEAATRDIPAAPSSGPVALSAEEETSSKDTKTPEDVAHRSGIEETGKYTDSEGRFFSPLVRNIAAKENISPEELRSIPGTGAGGKLTKSDLLAYLNRMSDENRTETSTHSFENTKIPIPGPAGGSTENELEEVVNMTRIRHTIAQHMIQSLDTAAHATSVIEADMTRIVKWRMRNKATFQDTYGIKLTYTPIFIKLVAGLLREFPYLNSSVRDNQVVLKKYINIGIATALPDHTLIVPVVKNADEYNLVGIARISQDLILRARQNTLKADEVRQGTFTLTNIGTFDNLIGTPIINQPEVAILATGAIVKKPAVIETDEGDFIGIRHKMYLSLSFDHRIVDGFLAGTFLKSLVSKLESFDEEDL